MDYYKNYKKIKTIFNKYEFLIIMDIPEIGSYLYVFENGIDIYDYLQDSVEICKEFAFEEWGVPIDSWVEVKEDDSLYLNFLL